MQHRKRAVLKERPSRANSLSPSVRRVSTTAESASELETRRLLYFAMLLLLGVSATLSRRAGWRDFGVAFVCVGSFGVAMSALRLLQERRLAQARREVEEKRRRVRAERMERHLRERASKQARREAKTLAALRQTEARMQRRRAECLSLAEAESRRAALEWQIAEEAGRFTALSESELIAEAAAIFAKRGYRIETPEPEAECDLRLTSEDRDRFEVARCVPTGRIAGVVDVQAVEAWRAQIGASQAYLIALSGFTPAAARLVRSLPVTLVEAHLLAHWKHTR